MKGGGRHATGWCLYVKHFVRGTVSVSTTTTTDGVGNGLVAAISGNGGEFLSGTGRRRAASCC